MSDEGGIILNKIYSMDDKQFIFGALLVVANRMDTILERELREYKITTKQWFLSIIIDNLFGEPPTIKSVAREMGTSHQNVKQVALKLEQKGFLKLEKDIDDARVTRLMLTEDSYKFWSKIEHKCFAFIEALYKNIEDKDLANTREVLLKMSSNLTDME